VPGDSDDEGDADAPDEEVGGDGEQLARLTHAPKVHGDEHDDEEDRHLHAVFVEIGERGDDVVHSGRDGYGDRHRVVDEEGRPHDEARLCAEVLVGNLVVPAARGVGAYELAVRNDDNAKESHDRRRDPGREGEEGEPPDAQDHEQFLRAIRDGGEGVGREDGQGNPLAQALALKVRVCDRATEDYSLVDLERGGHKRRCYSRPGSQAQIAVMGITAADRGGRDPVLCGTVVDGA
jgi:hypothetical protein